MLKIIITEEGKSNKPVFVLSPHDIESENGKKVELAMKMLMNATGDRFRIDVHSSFMWKERCKKATSTLLPAATALSTGKANAKPDAAIIIDFLTSIGDSEGFLQQVQGE